MRLPSHLLATLLVAACEPATHEPQCKSEPVVETVEVQKPAAGPKLVQPQPTQQQPQPQPTRPEPKPVVKKPEKRMVWASVCGHTELVPEKTALVRCGRG